MHLMIDLETLSLAPNAVVTQLGYASFDLIPKEGQIDGIIESGCFHIDPEIQIKLGRSMSWSTISWWMDQEDGPRKKLGNSFSHMRVGPQHALLNFRDKFNWTNVEGVWGNGSSFDLPILETLFNDCGVKVPWHYRAPRDCRTLAMLVDQETVKVSNPVKHSAEHDAIAQAKWMQNCYREIKAGRVI